MNNELINYVDEKGKIVVGAPVKSYQVKSEEDLEVLKAAHCGPGTLAYLPDDSAKWVFGTDEEWHEKTDSGNSGGGDSSGGIMIVTVFDGETSNTYIADKTFAEIEAAWESGMLPVVRYMNNIYSLGYVDSNAHEMRFDGYVGVGQQGISKEWFFVSNDGWESYSAIYPEA